MSHRIVVMLLVAVVALPTVLAVDGRVTPKVALDVPAIRVDDPIVGAGLAPPACAAALGRLQRALTLTFTFNAEVAEALSESMSECEAIRTLTMPLTAATQTPCAVPSESWPSVQATMTIIVNGSAPHTFGDTFETATVTRVDAGAYTQTYYGSNPESFGLFATDGGLGQVIVRGARYAADGQASVECTGGRLCPASGSATAAFAPLLIVTVGSAFGCEA